MAHTEYIREVPDSHTAILFLHGIIGSPDHFGFLLPRIPKSWSVYNLLLHGHGGSVRDFSRSSMAKWETQVNEVLSRL